MKKGFFTGSDIGYIAVGTDYNNYIKISNKFGDGTNIIDFVDKDPDYNDAEFITCIKSNGTMKIFYYDCPDEKTKYEILEQGKYAIYIDKNSRFYRFVDKNIVAKFYIVKWN